MTDKIETTRRGVLGAMAAGAAAATGAIPAAAQGGQKTFVLVHGAWHGGWCWRRVTDLLEKKGHKVFTSTMTGRTYQLPVCIAARPPDTATGTIGACALIAMMKPPFLNGSISDRKSVV